MKKLTLVAITLALCFATGFTCSKNAPQTATETTPNATSTETVDQSNMEAPPAGTQTVPATATPVGTIPAAAQSAVPAETK
ncbi:MAG: acylneuraminate cytidylyltransferase [Bdellovibrio sp.]|nr:acylneuraminate cytidylyltransferase [Bdellovibrio sp.]